MEILCLMVLLIPAVAFVLLALPDENESSTDEPTRNWGVVWNHCPRYRAKSEWDFTPEEGRKCIEWLKHNMGNTYPTFCKVNGRLYAVDANITDYEASRALIIKLANGTVDGWTPYNDFELFMANYLKYVDLGHPFEKGLNHEFWAGSYECTYITPHRLGVWERQYTYYNWYPTTIKGNVGVIKKYDSLLNKEYEVRRALPAQLKQVCELEFMKNIIEL